MGERYDRDLNDIFALQDAISEAIVSALKLTLLPAEKKAIEQRSCEGVDRAGDAARVRQPQPALQPRVRDGVARQLDRAIELLEPVLERAQKQNLIWFGNDNSLDPPRDDPRTQAMLARAEARLAAT